MARSANGQRQCCVRTPGCSASHTGRGCQHPATFNRPSDRRRRTRGHRVQRRQVPPGPAGCGVVVLPQPAIAGAAEQQFVTQLLLLECASFRASGNERLDRESGFGQPQGRPVLGKPRLETIGSEQALALSHDDQLFPLRLARRGDDPGHARPLAAFVEWSQEDRVCQT